MNKPWLLLIALVSLPCVAADIVIRPSAPTTTRSGYERSVSLNAQLTTLTLGDAQLLLGAQQFAVGGDDLADGLRDIGLEIQAVGLLGKARQAQWCSRGPLDNQK